MSRLGVSSARWHATVGRLIGALLAVSLLALGDPPVVLAQSVDDALRKEIEALKEGQATIHKELGEIKDLLRGRAPSEQTAAPPGDVQVPVYGAPAMGEGRAKLTLVDFSDYQCPFCRRHARQVLPALVRAYVETGKLRYVFRDFPIDSVHPQAHRLHKAAYCAGDQGKYWEMHDRLFDDPHRTDPKDLASRARALGLDVLRFERCLADGVHVARVRQGVADGEKARVRGTPTFFLGLTEPDGKPIRPQRFIIGAQPYEAFRQAIDGLLAELR